MCPVFCAPHGGAVAPQRRKIRYRPEAKPRGDFGRPMRAAIPMLAALGAIDHTGFSKVSHFAGQNGTLIRRPRWRARACEMRGAGGARPRGVVCVVWDVMLVEALLGASPPCPPIYVLASAASVSEATHGRRCAKPSDTGMTTYDMLKGIKDSIYLPTRTKAVFSLESEGFLFDKTKRNPSE